MPYTRARRSTLEVQGVRRGTSRRGRSPALAAEGASDARIQAMLRWASVDALNCYKQCEVSEYAGWVAMASGARVDSHRTHHLPRAPTNDKAPRDPTRVDGLRFEEDDIVVLVKPSS